MAGPPAPPGLRRSHDLLLLADAQTSAGLLVVGGLPGYPVVGHTVVGRGIEVRRRDSPAET
jgi:hypothetical protein